MTQEIEHLPSKCDALGSIPNNPKIKNVSSPFQLRTKSGNSITLELATGDRERKPHPFGCPDLHTLNPGVLPFPVNT
jgi:hypothetical protein